MTNLGGIEPAVWQRMLEGIALKRYELLLGAGISRDVRDRSHVTLPSGQGLANEMAAEFDLKVSDQEKNDLTRIFRAARRRPSRGGGSRDDWLLQRFTRTQPPSWYKILNSVSWRSIWTLNIDDAVERALGDNVRSFHFTDGLTRLRDGVIPVVHLHGDARYPEKGFVFSVEEYRNFVDSPRSLPIQFQEVLSDRPFIIIGAALYHEFDLASALGARARATARPEPTIAVLPSPTDMDREDFAEWNIEVFDGTAEEFLTSLRETLPDAVDELADTSSKAPTPAILRFLEDWHPTLQGRKTRWHEYLSGDEPEPSDVVSGLIVQRNVEAGILEDLSQGHPVLLSGRPFTGKSSTALRISKQLQDQGYKVFSFSAEASIDVASALVRIREFPRTVLYVESASEFVRSLEDLIDRAQEEGIQLRLLAVERDGPADRLKALGTFKEHDIRGRLEDNELESLVVLLRRKGVIVSKWRQPESTTVKKLRGAKIFDMTTVITELVLGEALEERVRKNYRSIQDRGSRNVAILAALGSRVGGAISIGTAAIALGVSARVIEERLLSDQTTHSMAQIVAGKVRLRHRLFGDLLTERVVTQKEMYNLLVGLCQALAPQMSPQAIFDNTWAYRMLRHVLDHEQLAKLIGRPRLDEFYSAIENGYEWNSRFWEQRALAASTDGDHPAAERFAKNAVEANRDGYSLTTLATVKLRRLAHSSPGLGDSAADTEFWVAVRLLRDARDNGVHASEHPFVTFFYNALTYGKRAKAHGRALPVDVRREWSEWWSAAENHQAFQLGRRSDELSKFQREWLMLAADK